MRLRRMKRQGTQHADKYTQKFGRKTVIIIYNAVSDTALHLRTEREPFLKSTQLPGSPVFLLKNWGTWEKIES